nr:fibronectin type III domain-containing protein [Akkermansiaceae bacterium]
QLRTGGFLVLTRQVPTIDTSPHPADPAWNQRPFEAQYLKLYDVTPPPAPAPPAGPNLSGYAIGSSITFAWSPAPDPLGGVSGYHLRVGTTPGGADLFDAPVAGTSATLGGLAYGTIVHAAVSQANNAGILGPFSAASAAIEMLDPAADRDGDGQSNGREDAAGTDPFDPQSVFRVLAGERAGDVFRVTVTSVPGRVYQLETSPDLRASSWQPSGAPVPATGATLVLEAPVRAAVPREFHRVKVSAL